MINPGAKYGAQVDTSTDPTGWPFGQARNITVPGDGTATPLEKDWLSDWFGFQQAMAVEAGLTPSGNPDKVGACQMLEALDTLFYRQSVVDSEIAAAVSTAVESGTYTPTYSNESNVSTLTSTFAQFLRVENRVQVAIYVLYTATGSGAKSFRMTLPVAPANFADAKRCSGSGLAEAASGRAQVEVEAVAGAAVATLNWTDTDSSLSKVLRANFMYTTDNS